MILKQKNKKRLKKIMINLILNQNYIFPKDEPIERKQKKFSPEYVFIFDDLGNDLRNRSITQLLKTSRHYKAKVIV